eukprot:CAMPEP_0113288034 /NCGR_PEP_ID=MMETSP0008_2-20120614/32057_1 /TAXON_ID=97485 /ORGANISM="Prymnesium parvum" /LENGTH=205 /DNA_ID=CAMNT_0000139367 /DNA_START=12 /DNA_END=631 /DNA_ORIENTATION=+ /assembly_acc=CAM_ASM_000153
MTLGKTLAAAEWHEGPSLDKATTPFGVNLRPQPAAPVPSTGAVLSPSSSVAFTSDEYARDANSVSSTRAIDDYEFRCSSVAVIFCCLQLQTSMPGMRTQAAAPVPSTIMISAAVLSPSSSVAFSFRRVCQGSELSQVEFSCRYARMLNLHGKSFDNRAAALNTILRTRLHTQLVLVSLGLASTVRDGAYAPQLSYTDQWKSCEPK